MPAQDIRLWCCHCKFCSGIARFPCDNTAFSKFLVTLLTIKYITFKLVGLFLLFTALLVWLGESMPYKYEGVVYR